MLKQETISKISELTTKNVFHISVTTEELDKLHISS